MVKLLPHSVHFSLLKSRAYIGSSCLVRRRAASLVVEHCWCVIVSLVEVSGCSRDHCGLRAFPVLGPILWYSLPRL